MADGTQSGPGPAATGAGDVINGISDAAGILGAHIASGELATALRGANPLISALGLSATLMPAALNGHIATQAALVGALSGSAILAAAMPLALAAASPAIAVFGAAALGYFGGKAAEAAYAAAAGALFDAARRTDPLVLDLDGDGIELLSLTDSKAMFDMDGDGFVERVGWVGSDDGLLAMDRDGDGGISGIGELFGNATQTGFAALAALDTSGDGKIDAADAEFASLRVWRDIDGDGAGQATELLSLSQAGIVSIDLASVSAQQTVAGSDISALGSFAREDGSAGVVADVSFASNARLTFDTRPYELDLEALFLPTLRGYGSIADLTASMSRDPVLLEMVKELALSSLSSVTNDQIQAIMFRWAGVDDVDPSSRGGLVDARKLTFLEAFNGTPFVNVRGGNDVPWVPTATRLEQAFAEVFDAVKLRLLAQAQLAEVLGPGAFDYLGDRFAADLDVQAVLSRASTVAADAAADGGGTAAAIAWWRAALPILDEVAADASAADYATWIEAAIRASTDDAIGVEDIRDSRITGTSGADTINGAGGNDTLVGNGGDDTYLFAASHGHDLIIETGGGNDSIVFAEGILPAAVTLDRAGASRDDLLLSTGTGDQITIKGYFAVDPYGNPTSRIEQIVFADGTIWDYAFVYTEVSTGTAGDDILDGVSAVDTLDGAAGNDTLDGREGDDLLKGSAGNDSLFGGTNYYSESGNDTLVGGAGNDTLNGAQGNDLYVFARGDGQDRIYDTGGGIDSISFAADILPGEVTLSRTGSNADDLLISISGGDQILVQGYFGKDYYSNYSFRIEHIVFADGTDWDYGAILAKLSTGGAGNDTIYGLDATGSYNGIDTLDGGDGNDVLDGRTANDLLIGGAGNDSLFGGTNYYSESGNDTLVGGAGNDTLDGAQGNDLYVFARGDGQDRVFDNGGGIDSISFDADILPGEVTLSRTGSNADDLLVSIDGGDQILVQGYFGKDYYSNYSYRIEHILFADGTEWDYATILAKVSTGGAGNDTIYGLDATGSYNGIDTLDGGEGNDVLDGRTASDLLIGGAGNDSLFGGTNYYSESGNDTLVGGTGDDTLNGAQGNDLYVFARGDGQDRVYDNAGGIDTISFAADILPSEVTLSRTGTNADDLLISISGGDQITVQGYFAKDYYSNYSYRIEQITFADGTSWDYSTIVAKVTGGTAGNDTLLGEASSNVIGGGDGNDRIEGLGGNDVLDGGSGTDTVLGGNDNDLITGGAGNDSLSGDAGNDTMSGDTGNDTLNGGQGDDLYVFARGDGQDRIYDNGGGVDSIAFAADILPSKVTLSRTGSNADDLLISIAGGDQILVQSYFGKDYYSNYTYRIEHIVFADGTDWDYSAILTKVSTGGAGNDTIYGLDSTGSYNGVDTLDGGDGNDVLDGRTANDLLLGGGGNDSLFGGTNYYSESGNDTLIGGTGNDTLNGAQGNDLYVFARGDGQDRVYDNAGGIDTISFAADILPSEVTLSRTGTNADDLLISISGGDQILVQSYFGKDYYSNYTYRIEQITFADGSSWDYSTIVAKVSTGGAGNDTIYGLDATGSYNGIDTLDGGGGNDVLDGRTANDLLIGGAGNDSLFGGTNYYSESGNDTLIGGTGSDTLNGAQGNDLYVFARGDGQDRVYDNAGGIDTISFAADILPSEVTLSRTGANADDLLINISGGDQILVQGYFGKDYYSNYTYRIEHILFDDGTNWDYSAILAKVSTGGVGNDTIYGLDATGSYNGIDTLDGGEGNDTLDGRTANDLLIGGAGNDSLFGGTNYYSESGNDTLIGGTGNDTLNGAQGNDLYVFARGDGQDRVYDNAGGLDTISFAADILPSEVTLSRTGTNADDLLISISGGDQILVQSYFGKDYYSNYTYCIEQIAFADGTNWDYATILAKVTTGSSSADALIGDQGANLIEGLDGNDTIQGREGNDTLDGGLGNDSLVGGTGDDLYFVDSPTDVVTESGSQGTDEVRATASSFTLGGNIERLVYTGSGDFAGTGSSGAETIIGSAGADTLRGMAGNDDLRGGDGADVLVGGAGADTLTGGAGADTFRFELSSESGTASGADRVLDFSQADGDLIDLATIDANTAVAGDQAFSFIGTGAFVSGTRGQLRFENRGDGNSWVQADLDGNTAAEFEIMLAGTRTLTAADFML